MAKIISQYRDEAKKRIIQAGFEVLYEKGYCNTSMEEIAHRLDVTKPALYRYFSSKDELIIACAKEGQKEYHRIISEQKKKICPLNSWLEIFDRVIVSDPGYQSVYLDIVSMSYRSEGLHAYSCQRMDEEIEAMTQKYLKLQNEGIIRSDIDPKFFSITLISLFNGMRVQLLLGVKRDLLRDTWLKNLHGLFFSPDQDLSSDCEECKWLPDCNRVMQNPKSKNIE